MTPCVYVCMCVCVCVCIHAYRVFHFICDSQISHFRKNVSGKNCMVSKGT